MLRAKGFRHRSRHLRVRRGDRAPLVWWDTIGRRRYPHADRLLICADGGGSNGYRVRIEHRLTPA